MINPLDWGLATGDWEVFLGESDGPQKGLNPLPGEDLGDPVILISSALLRPPRIQEHRQASRHLREGADRAHLGVVMKPKLIIHVNGSAQLLR